MPQKKHKPEEIVAKLRQVDVLLSQGRPVAEAIRTISVTPFTYYRWRKEFGGLKSDQVKRLTAQEARAAAEAIVRAAAADATRAWVEAQRLAGASIDAVAAEFRASRPDAEVIERRTVLAIVALLLAIAEGEAEAAFDAAVFEAERRGHC